MASPASGNATCIPRPPGFDSAATFGPWFVGLGLELLMTGVAFDMTLTYFRLHAAGDRLGMRVLVTILMILCALKSLDSAAMAWHSMITLFGTYIGVTMPSQWYNKLHPLMSAIIVVISQFFFLLRLNAILKNKRWLLIIIILFMLLSVASHLVTSIELFRRLASPTARAAQGPANTGLIGTDVLLCGAFTYVLINSKTGVKKTDSILTRLIFLSFTSAGVPMLIDIGKMIAVVWFSPKSEAFMAFSFVQSKVYIIAVLVTLNFRGSLRNNEAFFFTTGTGAVSYPSVQLNGSGELVSHTDSSAPRPSASRGTTGRATASRGAANSDRRSGTDWRELVDLRSGGGRRSTISVTVDLPRGPRDVEDLRSVREQEEHGEGVDKRAGVHGSTRDTYEEACECGRRRKRRPSADG